MEKIVPFLWFDDQAEEAANFYVSVFSKRPGAGTSRVRGITRYGEAGPRPAGMVMTVEFELEGQAMTALNGGPEFSFTEAFSLAVNCDSQQEVNYLWTALSEGGEEGPCGWLKDRYGLSWQIVPVRLTELLNDPDEAAAQRVMAAMLQMTRLDIAELERAYAAGAPSGPASSGRPHRPDGVKAIPGLSSAGSLATVRRVQLGRDEGGP